MKLIIAIVNSDDSSSVQAALTEEGTSLQNYQQQVDS